MVCRSDFELRLLALFSDVGLEARTEPQLRDLGSLLPAIADAWHEDRLPSTRLLMTSSSMDFQALQQHQRCDSQLVKVRADPLNTLSTLPELRRENPNPKLSGLCLFAILLPANIDPHFL